MSKYRKTKLIRISPKTFIQSDSVGYNIYKKDTGDVYRKYINMDHEYTSKEMESLENENMAIQKD